jgi:hypothetical protein
LGNGDAEDVAVGGTAVAFVDFVFEEACFFGERCGAPGDAADAIGSGEPGVVLGVDGDPADVVSGEPAEALAVLPICAVEVDGAFGGADPDASVAGGCE